MFDCVNDLMDGALTSHSHLVHLQQDSDTQEIRPIDLYSLVIAKYFGGEDSIIRKL